MLKGEEEEPEFGRTRAEIVRRRARAYGLLMALLWVPLMLFVDPLNYGSMQGGLWVRLPTLTAVVAMVVYLRRKRGRWATEAAAIGAFGFLFAIWARVVETCTPDTVMPNMLSIILASIATAAGLLLSWQGTAVLCGIANVAMFAGGLLRVPRPEPAYFYLVSTAVVIYPLLVLGAASRDRWQRTQIAARQKLHELNEQLQREQQARSRLFVNLSHDFRTPLAVVRAAVELLRRGDGDREEALDRIDANAGAIVDLIDQLLELARLDAAKTPLVPVACDAGAVAREVIGQLDPGHGGIALTVDAPAPVVAHVDPAHLRRILQNLVANALRQVDATGGRVAVAMHAAADGAPVIDVIDNGPGVAVAARPRLFERFATFGLAGGTAGGIGLPLARELAELNGGNLVLVADATETTFRLTLRPGEGEMSAVPVPLHHPAPPPVDVPSDPSPQVLIVEDNAELRATVCQLLAPRFRVAGVGTLAAARAALARHQPQAIVCDVMLPDGDGYTLLAALRAGRRFDRVPVILLTALGEPAERVRGLAAGADDYVTKPFSGAELGARVATAIERAAERSAAVERQREDLLMELHDGVCGSLARAVLALDRAAAGGGDSQGLGAAVASVRDGLAEARGLLGTLGAAASWDQLVAQLRWEAVAACERAGVTLALTTDGVPPATVAPAAAHALRRIACEAITNALRHGAPTAVRIVLGAGERELRLRVEDDGRGGATVIAGHGLSNVRRRARRLGGDARFAAGPGGGFVLEAWVQASHPSDEGLSWPSPAPSVPAQSSTGSA